MRHETSPGHQAELSPHHGRYQGSRRRWRLGVRWLLVLASPVAASCGNLNPSADTPDAGGADVLAGVGPLLPWKAGNTWTFRVTEGGQTSTKVTTVGPEEPVGGSGPNAGLLANRVTTRKGLNDTTSSWQSQVGALIVRYREQAFHAATGALELEEHWSPHKLHLDGSAEHTAAGATWLELYEETKMSPASSPVTTTARDRWTVVSQDEPVSVPAGTFRAVVLQKAGSSTAKTYWYVRGIGKVKETGGQTEELVSYEVQP
jgi:hypothetical protein